MLEVTIYRTLHGGRTNGLARKEARKVERILKNHDVFSLEFPGSSHARAKFAEAAWNKLLKTYHQADAQNQTYLCKTVLPKFCSIVENTENEPYLSPLYKALLREEKPIYCIERWPGRTDEPVLFQRSREAFNGGLDRVVAGEVEEGTQQCYDALKSMHELTVKRDRHAAELLTRAEEVIRQTYLIIADKNPLRLGIQIGAAHRIERFYSGPTTIIDFTPEEYGGSMGKINELFWEEAPPSELIPLVRDRILDELVKSRKR